MITSGSLQLILTVLCAATGSVRTFRLLQRGRRGAHRCADVIHLLMSAGMIAMCWSWGTGLPRRPQEVLFGLSVLWFLVAAAHERRGHVLYHAVMVAGMVWMVAAMPDLMPVSGPAGPSGMDMPGMSMPTGSGSGGDRPWTVAAIGYPLAVVLTIGAWWWIARSLDAARSPDRVGGRTAWEWTDSAGHGAMSLAMAVMIVVLL